MFVVGKDDDRAVYSNNSGQKTATVGSKPNGTSWAGALDMAGNAWEWTNTVYDTQRFPYPYNANDGRESEDGTTSPRVLRGGSWFDDEINLRSAYRDDLDPVDSLTPDATETPPPVGNCRASRSGSFRWLAASSPAIVLNASTREPNSSRVSGSIR